MCSHDFMFLWPAIHTRYIHNLLYHNVGANWHGGAGKPNGERVKRHVQSGVCRHGIQRRGEFRDLVENLLSIAPTFVHVDDSYRGETLPHH